jgi:predicted ester cyclase
MSTEDNKKIARRMIEEPWNQGNLDALDEICDPSYRVERIGGIAELKQGIAEFKRGFPDTRWTVEEVIAEGDTVVVRWSLRGTHMGEFEGIAPTGKVLTTTGISIYHFANGKIVDDRFETGWPDMRQYLLGSQ